MKHFTKAVFIVALFACSVAMAQQRDTLEIQRNGAGIITFARFMPSNERIIANGKNFLKQVLKAGEKDDFRLLKENHDEHGLTHQRYQQYYQDIKVEGAEYLIHGKNGVIKSINGDFRRVNVPTTSASITEKVAITHALAYVNAKKYKWQDEALEGFVKQHTGNANATYYPKGELVIMRDILRDKGKLKLAWKLTISSLIPNDEQLVYVDARSGEVIGASSLILDANTPCMAETLYSFGKQITGDSFAGGFRLRETRNSVDVRTLNLNNSENYAFATDFVNTNTNWTSGSWANFTQDRQALDVHWAAEMVLDYWRNVHNRNSIDGNGIAVLSYVHRGSNWANAAWVGGAFNHFMIYGDGNGTTLKPLVALDIAAHEFGHGVNEFTANLGAGLGWDESDALNEGFSDIWAACVERWAAPSKKTWRLGEDVLATTTYNCIRNLQYPANAKAWEGLHPDTYHGSYWNYQNEPHFNSTVLSHWFYLLANGGNGVNDNFNSYSVTGIGLNAATRIAYQAELNYLFSSATYMDARNATISAAQDFICENSPEVKAVQDAWYAVGVGTQYSGAPVITINGPVAACPAQYTVTNIPAGGQFTWSYSSNLQRIGQGQNSIVLGPASGAQRASGWIEVNFTGSTGCQTIVHRDIWVGPPANAETGITGPNTLCPNGTGRFYAPSFPVEQGVTSYNWTLPSSVTILSGGGSYDYIEVKAASNFTGGLFIAKGINNCGLSIQSDKYIPLGNCTAFAYSVYPNPAKNSIDISLVEGPGHEDLSTDDNQSKAHHGTGIDGPLEITISNNMMVPVLKTRIESNGGRIDISNIPKGWYILQINNGRKIDSRHIFVE